jgi:hypothetical protein
MIRAVSAGKPSEGETVNARLAAIRTDGSLVASNEIEIARVAKLTRRAKQRTLRCRSKKKPTTEVVSLIVPH